MSDSAFWTRVGVPLAELRADHSPVWHHTLRISSSYFHLHLDTHFKMPQAKRQKVAEETKPDENPGAVPSDSEASGSRNSSHVSESEAESLSTEEEILESQRQIKSKKTQKRKRRATSPSQFGSTLLALLDTDTPAALPFALKPSVEKRRTQELSEAKTRKASDVERKEREEKGHIQDVIGGWGAERERSLRKVAQRGGGYKTLHSRTV